MGSGSAQLQGHSCPELLLVPALLQVGGGTHQGPFPWVKVPADLLVVPTAWAGAAAPGQCCWVTAAGELEHLVLLLPPGPDASLSFSWQLSEGKMMERRKKIALELSELVVYCRPVPFDEESEHLLVRWPALAVTVALGTPRGAPRCCLG